MGEEQRELNDTDWDNAERYFQINPGQIFCGKKSGLMHSYLISDGRVFRRGDEVGKGSYGRVKFAYERWALGFAFVIKRYKKPVYPLNKRNTIFANQLVEEQQKKIDALRGQPDSEKTVQDSINRLNALKYPNLKISEIITEYYWLPKIQKEAAINCDLRIGRSPVLVRQDAERNIYKAYQLMCYLGIPLPNFLQRYATNDQIRLDYAIRLLQIVLDLHTGRASEQGKVYVNRDIKLDNLVVDENGELHLIDNGFAKDDELNVKHVTRVGTEEYKPISFNSTEVEETPNYFFDDTIATLRTIFHEKKKTGILTEEGFGRLPSYIRAILDTSDIKKCINNHNQYTIKYIMSVLLLYRYSSASCSKYTVQSLLKRDAEQDRIIQEYRENQLKDKGLCQTQDANKKTSTRSFLPNFLSWNVTSIFRVFGPAKNNSDVSVSNRFELST